MYSAVELDFALPMSGRQAVFLGDILRPTVPLLGGSCRRIDF